METVIVHKNLDISQSRGSLESCDSGALKFQVGTKILSNHFAIGSHNIDAAFYHY